MMAAFGDYPVDNTHVWPTLLPEQTWPSTAGGTYVYGYGWGPTKAEFDELKADVARLTELVERIHGHLFPDDGPPPEPLKADDI
jgi:hypothetical protein